MPQPHPFDAAPASKGQVRAIPKNPMSRFTAMPASPAGQTVDAQARQLRAAGAGKVFREIASGAKTGRAQLRRLVSELAAGDVVMVTRLDRLARSTRDAAITGKKAGFPSLGNTWADTTTSHGRLMLTVLGGLADVERDLIHARTAEGRNRAKAQGKQMGPPPTLTPEQRKEASRRRAQGATLQELAHSYNVGISNIRRAARAV